METHRYVRKKLTQGTVDAYDSLSSKQSPTNYTKIEYWTNGFTTHLMSTPDANVVIPPSVTASFQTTTSYRPPTPPSLKLQENVIRNSVLAGSLAGTAATLACHPFDVLRTKMQAATLDFASSPASSSSSSSISTINRAASIAARGVTASTTTTTTLAGPIQVLKHTIHHGGIAALYTGLAMPVAAQAVYKATLFTVNNVAQRFLIDWNTQERLKTGNLEPYRIRLTDRFLCGFIGGAVNGAVFVTPVEFVRNQLIAQHTRLAAQPKSSQLGLSQPRTMGSVDVIRHTIAQHGLSGMWRGVGVTIARDSLGCGCFFWAMAWTQQYCKSHHYGMSELNVNLLSGAMAGLGFWAVALPLDTIKTWIQTGATTSAVDAVRQSYQQRGVIGTAQQLTRGWQMAFGRGAPSAAITVVTYEYCYKYLQN